MVERVVWDHEVAGSNPVTPIPGTCMFSVYLLRSSKTGRDMLDLVRIFPIAYGDIMLAKLLRQNMDCLGPLFMRNNS